MNTIDFSSAQWRKSSRSGTEGGDCVEMATVWRKSSRSGTEGGQCVEVADLAAAVGIRDSKDPAGPKLAIGRRSLQSFFNDVKSGAFDA